MTSATAGLDHPLVAGLSGFVELFGVTRPQGDRSDLLGLMLDGGLTYGLGADTQLDVSAGQALREPSNGWFIGVGVARRP